MREIQEMRLHLREEEQKHCAIDIDEVAALHAQEARSKEMIKDVVDLTSPDFVVRLKHLRFLRN
jgi:hypothetical protein